MRGTAGKIETAQIGASIAGLEGAEEVPMARQSVDRTVEDVIAVVDVRGVSTSSNTILDSMSLIPAVRLSFSRITRRYSGSILLQS